MPSEKTEPTFEQRLEELNSLITALESGGLGLEESIHTFERGQAIHKELLQRLDGFEKRIQQLISTRDGETRVLDAPEFDPVAGVARPGQNKDDEDVPF